MTRADAPAFRAALRRLELAYGCPVDAARDPVFFDALAEFPIATVIRATDDLACHHRTASGRFPITHDLKDRCREYLHAAEIHHPPPRPLRSELDDGTPPMSKAEFFARLDTLRRKAARAKPLPRRQSSLIPLSQIADSLTHPHAVPESDPLPTADATPTREREAGENDLPLTEDH